MNLKKQLLTTIVLAGCTAVFAQRTPTHPLDITDTDFKDLVSNIQTWQPGSQPKGVSKLDDEFYISRQRPLKRIAEADDYQAETSEYAVKGRKFCLWTPLDDPTSSWKALPRYCFEGDNFSMWSYIDIHGNWTAPWFRVTAGLTDVAHKNGVKIGCVASIPFGHYIQIGGINGWSQILTKLCEQNEDDETYKNSMRFVKLLKYYGIDGVGVNSEFGSDADDMEQIQGFFADCHKKAKEIGWEFQLHWYDGTNDKGSLSFDQGLGMHNENMFGKKDNIVTDMMFSNYNTGKSVLQASAAKAKQMGRNPYDYYKGFDIQGRSLSNQWNAKWTDLEGVEASIGFWGAHAQGLIHQSSTDYGTSDVAIQKAYLDKQEYVFSGGYRNPAHTPNVPTADITLANGSMKNRFQGVAHYVTAKSTIQQLPFVSRFNLGNGLKFYNDGNITFNHKWHNIATQDFLPTWRWWIVDANEKADANNLAQAELTWDDAYFGGSCLRLMGKTNVSRIKLFKTLLKVEPAHELSITYKLTNNLKTNAKLFVALKGKLTEYKEIDIPEAKEFGKWTTFTTTLDKLGIKVGDEVALIGITLNNTAADYNMLVGKLSLQNPKQVFKPVTPTVKEVKIIRGKGSTVDFKMRYASKEETGEQKTYNDEVDTWYYEIFFQQENHAQQLLTATTSWAAYVVDAPIVPGFENRKGRFGVRAVSPNGTTKSDIAWSEYKEIPYDTPSAEIIIDKAVIKPNETFKVSLEDQMASPAQSFKILNAITGQQVGATQQNCKAFDAQIKEVGTYDLVVVDAKGNTQTLRGKIHISPDETGAVPVVESISADKNEAKKDEPIKLTYTSKDGEGKVSRGLVVRDPNMLLIPGEVQQGMAYSVALWVKVDNYAHDKQGTNLIQKNTIKDKWPHNNWGDFWVQVRPEWTNPNHPRETHLANEVSFNTMGWEAHDNPKADMMSKGYSLNPGVWNHIVVTQDAGAQQQIFFNGKRVAGPVNFTSSMRREDKAKSDYRIDKNTVANIYIGGGGVYKAGLNATIDEVQVWNKALTEDEVKRAMKGYNASEVPEGLQAYYTFEELNKTDSTFANYGKAGNQYKAKMVVVENSGGEKTGDAYYKTVGANNEVTGYPGITGTLDVKATHKWIVNGGRISSETDKTAIITYAKEGTYPVGVSVANFWGEAEKMLEKTITISTSDGISKVNGNTHVAVYPNPFVESVNIKFEDGGNYTIRISNLSGSVLQTNNFKAQAQSVVNVGITAQSGMYLLQIIKGSKTLKTIKILKK